MAERQSLPANLQAAPVDGCSRTLPSRNSPATTQREVVAAFLAAAREGDFGALLRLLDPDVVVRADAVAVDIASARADAGAPELNAVMHGVDAVARVFAGGAKAARLALVDGLPGAVVSVGGRPMAVFDFTVRNGRVVGIELLADPETLSVLDLEPVRGAPNLRGSLKESGLVDGTGGRPSARGMMSTCARPCCCEEAHR